MDTRTLSIPAALQSITAFAGLSDAQEHHAIANAAEIGALLMLDASALLADVVVADASLQSQLSRALDALQMQITDRTLGLRDEWVDITDGSVSSTNITISPAHEAVFFRLVNP